MMTKTYQWNSLLSPAEMEQALMQIADEEMRQTERPIQTKLVEECHSLVYQLNGADMPSEQLMKESLMRVNRQLFRRSKRHAAIRFALKVAAVLILVLFTALFHDQLANQNLLHGNTTEDGTQYRIEGHNPTDTIIDTGSAVDTVKRIQLSTQNITEIEHILGYKPKLPSWIPDGWALSYYTLFSTEETLLFSATYENPACEEALVYSCHIYAHPDMAAATYEQDSEGTHETWNNQNVYLTTNIGYHMAIWTNGAESCHIGGPVSFDTLKKMFESIN